MNNLMAFGNSLILLLCIHFLQTDLCCSNLSPHFYKIHSVCSLAFLKWLSDPRMTAWSKYTYSIFIYIDVIVS